MGAYCSAYYTKGNTSEPDDLIQLCTLLTLGPEP